MEALANGRWLTRERVQAAAAISAVGGLVMLLILWLARHGTVDFFGQPVGSDFTAFWNAGRIANSGEASLAWDQQLLNASVQATHGVQYGTAWIYPPVFLLVAAPLAALPYLPALFIWQLLSFVAIALTLRAILPNQCALFVALASPFTPLVLANGQNAFLTAALLGSGLLLLSRRPHLAGGFFGCLLYKPQLGLIVGPLLLLMKCWRALMIAAATAAGLLVLSLIFGDRIAGPRSPTVYATAAFTWSRAPLVSTRAPACLQRRANGDCQSTRLMPCRAQDLSLR